MAVIFAQAEVTKLSTEAVLELLAALRPAVYGEWTPEALAAALGPDGVQPAQVWIDGANVRGYRAEAVTEALNTRQIEAWRPSGPKVDLAPDLRPPRARCGSLTCTDTIPSAWEGVCRLS
jgi:hypothetical protein